MCLSPEADKRQSMGELLTTWFPANDRTIYIMIQRKEPDVAEQSGALEGDDEAEKAGKGGKGGKGEGKGRKTLSSSGGVGMGTLFTSRNWESLKIWLLHVSGETGFHKLYQKFIVQLSL